MRATDSKMKGGFESLGNEEQALMGLDEDLVYGDRGDPALEVALSSCDGNVVGHEAGLLGFGDHELLGIEPFDIF